MELIRAPDKTQRLEIMFDNAICGYLHVRAWKVSACVIRVSCLRVW